jgi:hypothetical protein
LTNDSYYDSTYYEGYLTNRFLQIGDYKFYANLWADPQDYRPVYDIQYRSDQVSGLTSLYSPTYPRLSRQVSWLNDPTPTFAEADAGSYSDLQLAAVLTVPVAVAGMLTSPRDAASRRTAGFAVSPNTHELMRAQLTTIQRVLSERRAKRASPSVRGDRPILVQSPDGRGP